VNEDEDLLEAFTHIVNSKKRDADAFFLNTQADMLAMVHRHSHIIRKKLIFLRTILKEPEVTKFEDIKHEINAM
jgi:hypothetical protein